jgi:hypothetical protein
MVQCSAVNGDKGAEMQTWGLILNGLGAILVAIGQGSMARSTTMWLASLELEKASRLSGGDIYNVTGIDDHMRRSVNVNTWTSSVGWPIFILGIVLQVIPEFQHSGWAALKLF